MPYSIPLSPWKGYGELALETRSSMIPIPAACRPSFQHRSQWCGTPGIVVPGSEFSALTSFHRCQRLGPHRTAAGYPRRAASVWVYCPHGLGSERTHPGCPPSSSCPGCSPATAIPMCCQPASICARMWRPSSPGWDSPSGSPPTWFFFCSGCALLFSETSASDHWLEATGWRRLAEGGSWIANRWGRWRGWRWKVDATVICNKERCLLPQCAYVCVLLCWCVGVASDLFHSRSLNRFNWPRIACWICNCKSLIKLHERPCMRLVYVFIYKFHSCCDTLWPHWIDLFIFSQCDQNTRTSKNTFSIFCLKYIFFWGDSHLDRQILFFFFFE